MWGKNSAGEYCSRGSIAQKSRVGESCKNFFQEGVLQRVYLLMYFLKARLLVGMPPFLGGFLRHLPLTGFPFLVCGLSQCWSRAQPFALDSFILFSLAVNFLDTFFLFAIGWFYCVDAQKINDDDVSAWFPLSSSCSVPFVLPL